MGGSLYRAGQPMATSSGKWIFQSEGDGEGPLNIEGGERGEGEKGAQQRGVGGSGISMESEYGERLGEMDEHTGEHTNERQSNNAVG